MNSLRGRVGIRTDGDWPYGLRDNSEGQRRLVAWAEAHDVRLSHETRSRVDLLRRVVGNDIEPPSEVGAWLDHVILWKRDRTPVVITSYPYVLSDGDLIYLGRLAQRVGVTVRVGGTGWYGHDTVFVEVWRTAELERTLSEHLAAIADSTT